MAKDNDAPQSWDAFDDDVLNSSDTDTEFNLSGEEETDKVEEPIKVEPIKKVVKPVKKVEAVIEEPIEDPIEDKITDSTLEETESEVEDSYKFFEEVQKITGEELDVEYGDVDPLTPQGIAIREKVVKQVALDGFLEEIETNFPAAYKALQHAYNGGDVADLFKSVTSRDYSKIVLGENDTAAAKEIMKEYYESKGIKNPSRIARMIEGAEDSAEGLISEANGMIEELKANQLDEETEVLNSQRAKAESQKKQDSLMVGALDEILESGRLDSFKLNGARETAEFKKFALAGLRRASSGNGYEFATQIDSKNLEKLLKYKFFEFKNGDLSQLIQVKATTENTQKLRLRLAAESARQKSTASGTSRASQSLQDFDDE